MTLYKNLKISSKFIVIIENPIQFSPIFVINLSYINKIFTFFYMAYEKKK